MLIRSRLRNMNAIPSCNPVSGIQLLAWARFADLRGAKLFTSGKMVPAVGLEFTTRGLMGFSGAFPPRDE